MKKYTITGNRKKTMRIRRNRTDTEGAIKSFNPNNGEPHTVKFIAHQREDGIRRKR